MNTENNEHGHVEQQSDNNEASHSFQESNDEQSSATEQQAPPEQGSIVRTKLPIEKREADRIEKQRKTIYFANPEEVYFNHHIQRHWSSTIIQICSLICSVSVIGTLFYLIAITDDGYSKYIYGVGYVSDITIVDKLTLFSSLTIAFYGIKALLNNGGALLGKHYAIAMLSNAFAFVIVKHVKFIFYYMILFCFVAMGSEESFNTVLEQYSEGAFYDIINLFLNLISLYIIYRAFKACHREVTQ